MTTTKYYLQITNGQSLSERTSGLPGLPPGPSVPSENSIRLGFASARIIASFGSMFAILHALGMFVADMFKSRSRLETVWYFEKRGRRMPLSVFGVPKADIRAYGRIANVTAVTELYRNAAGLMPV